MSVRKARDRADERKDESGWWSDAPLGGQEQDMSPASRTAMGGDRLGISGQGATEPDEEGLGAATQDTPGAEDERGSSRDKQARRARQDAQADTVAGQSDRAPETTADAQPSAGEDQLGLTGQTGPSARGGLAGDQTDLGGDRQGLGG